MNFYDSYSWLLPSLLFSVLLIVVRVVYAGELMFAFLAWNLFLAILPLYFSFRLRAAGGRAQWYFACLWLLFFPNSMYIVTDLFHLRERAGMPLWYDLLLLLSAAINGVTMGFLSLCNVERWIKARVNTRYVSVVIFGLLLLCGYGIYLGRYLRWNSWDVIANPYDIMRDVKYIALNPQDNMRTWGVTFIFSALMITCYLTIKSLKRAIATNKE